MFCRDLFHGRSQFGLDREPMSPTSIARHRRSRAVERKIELIRQAIQCALPIRLLSTDDRVRIVLRAEDLALPERVVRVVHGQGFPGEVETGGASGVGTHHIARQRPERETVGCDVVDHEHQDVLGRGHLVQAGAERNSLGDVEPGEHHLFYRRGESMLLDGNRCQVGDDRSGGNYFLVSHSVCFRVHRAQ
jgi:hypothetical protein